eukprot:191979_1
MGNEQYVLDNTTKKAIALAFANTMKKENTMKKNIDTIREEVYSLALVKHGQKGDHSVQDVLQKMEQDKNPDAEQYESALDSYFNELYNEASKNNP